VTIAKPVTFYAINFPSNRRLSIELEVGGDVVGAHPCCVSNVGGHPRTNSSGRATIRFQWPRTYSVSPDGVHHRWDHLAVAFVVVTADGWSEIANPDAARATKLAFVN